VAQLNWANLRFRFAKTMPEIPHEYVVRSPENESDYVKLFDIIRREAASRNGAATPTATGTEATVTNIGP
jgi:hypothetical protein